MSLIISLLIFVIWWVTGRAAIILSEHLMFRTEGFNGKKSYTYFEFLFWEFSPVEIFLTVFWPLVCCVIGGSILVTLFIKLKEYLQNYITKSTFWNKKFFEL